MPLQPPNVNGVMEIALTSKASIKTKLTAIRTAFVPTDAQPACDTFFLVSTYNKQNAATPINGDTAESILA